MTDEEARKWFFLPTTPLHEAYSEYASSIDPQWAAKGWNSEDSKMVRDFLTCLTPLERVIYGLPD